jgi:hypothetical protein
MTLRDAQDTQAPQQRQRGAEQIEPPSTIHAQLPSGPVIVSYQNGQLMIEAMNATLSSVLQSAIKTGTAKKFRQVQNNGCSESSVLGRPRE